MTDAALPQPLTPPDCDLRGLKFMPLDVIRLVDSDLVAKSTGDEFKAAVVLWCKSWVQTPTASLPDDDEVLARLTATGAKWPKLKAGALRGWIKCSDGRLYHPVVAEKALEALPGRREYRERQSSSAERKAREREDRRRLFGLLREQNIVPEFDCPTKKLREMAEPFIVTPVTPEVTHVTNKITSPVTPVTKEVTAKRGTGTGTGTGTEERKEPNPLAQRIAAAGPVSKDDLDLVEARCRQALGEQSPADAVVGPMVLAARQFGLDQVAIILASESRRVRQKPIRTWKLWAEIITEQLSQPAIAEQARQAAEPRVDFGGGFSAPHSTIWLIWNKGEWNPHWGPKPGEPGCKLPRDLEHELLANPPKERATA